MDNNLMEWLARELDSRNLSARKLSRQIGKAENYVSQVMSGRMEPSVSFYLGLAEALDVPIEKILRLAGILPEGEGDQASLMAWMEAGRRLSVEERKQVLEYIDFVASKKKRRGSTQEPTFEPGD